MRLVLLQKNDSFTNLSPLAMHNFDFKIRRAEKISMITASISRQKRGAYFRLSFEDHAWDNRIRLLKGSKKVHLMAFNKKL